MLQARVVELLAQAPEEEVGPLGQAEDAGLVAAPDAATSRGPDAGDCEEQRGLADTRVARDQQGAAHMQAQREALQQDDARAVRPCGRPEAYAPQLQGRPGAGLLLELVREDEVVGCGAGGRELLEPRAILEDALGLLQDREYPASVDVQGRGPCRETRQRQDPGDEAAQRLEEEPCLRQRHAALDEVAKQGQSWRSQADCAEDGGQEQGTREPGGPGVPRLPDQGVQAPHARHLRVPAPEERDGLHVAEHAGDERAHVVHPLEEHPRDAAHEHRPEHDLRSQEEQQAEAVLQEARGVGLKPVPKEERGRCRLGQERDDGHELLREGGGVLADLVLRGLGALRGLQAVERLRCRLAAPVERTAQAPHAAQLQHAREL
mmetsp:Transcript_45324/g.144459  ORF Transcript_45324/g.144459 Transcript_45324/m.144459 type:complete len:377 (+) Transcript_45324:346-1476(+)